MGSVDRLKTMAGTRWPGPGEAPARFALLREAWAGLLVRERNKKAQPERYASRLDRWGGTGAQEFVRGYAAVQFGDARGIGCLAGPFRAWQAVAGFPAMHRCRRDFAGIGDLGQPYFIDSVLKVHGDRLTIS